MSARSPWNQKVQTITHNKEDGTISPECPKQIAVVAMWPMEIVDNGMADGENVE